MMKKLVHLTVFALIFVALTTIVDSKGKSSIPSVSIKNLKKEKVNTGKLHNDGKPFIINFWATWCKPCVLELNTIAEEYDDWVEETGVKLYAVSIDDARNSKRVAPFVKGKRWKYTVLLDENSDFKRAMNVNNPPHTFLYDGKGNLVWQHNGYAPGDEEELYEQVLKLVKK
jgi:cytochrome c biogenesis protein CcmG/thiol:disulfide interchange protein DsbE